MIGMRGLLTTFSSMNHAFHNYDERLDPPSTEAYDHMVENVCDMKAGKLRQECEARMIETEDATLEELRDALIDRLEWELNL